MNKQFLILGAGKFGSSVAKRLEELGQEVMVVDHDFEVVQKLSDEVRLVMQGDVTHEATLRELGAQNFDVVIVSIGKDIQSSIMVTLLLKEMGVKKIISKAVSDLHAKVLYRIGANRVVFPEREMGVRVAQNLVNNNIFDFINLSTEYTIVETAVVEEWIGKTVVEVEIRKKYHLNIIAIKSAGEITINVDPDTVFKEGDILIVIGHNDDIQALSELQ
ncbi:potassium channel family protein [Guggenheimella bovis]